MCLQYPDSETFKLPCHPQVSPFLIPALISNTASGVVAIEHKCRGPNFGVVSACATGTHAIGTAMDFMLRGEVRRLGGMARHFFYFRPIVHVVSCDVFLVS